MADTRKLDMWQERLRRNETAYSPELVLMDEREALYRGTHAVRGIVRDDDVTEAPHVRNIVSEIIEAEVDSSLPAPKVTAKRKQDEDKAKLIEDMLRNELDRLPFEVINDQMERTVPIQGGAAFWLEWDSEQRTHYTIGDLVVKPLHPKQIIPQDGVTTGIEDMDYIIIKVPVTKEYIKSRYGKDLRDEGEAEPELRGMSSDYSAAEDLLTMYIAYYRNTKGSIGRYAWCMDEELEDYEDYQARRLRRCAKCGAIEPPAGTEGIDFFAGNAMPGMPGDMLGGLMQAEAPRPPAEKDGRRVCPICGGDKWEESTEDVQEIYEPIVRTDGSIIPGLHQKRSASLDALGADGLPSVEIEMVPTEIPIYRPGIYPVILQKTVSVYGKFLGDSDAERMRDQQNTTNRIHAKIIEKLIGAGSYTTLPDDATIRVTPEIGKVIYPGDQAAMNMIRNIDLEGNIQQDMAYLEHVYEEARQNIGITDSFQGRRDTTATSGKAKEFAASQSAGRLESKRRQKDAAYAALFEAIFKFKLAYADEPRPVVAKDIHGKAKYEDFNRYDFLEQDAAGEWVWNDQFLFSVDTAAPLASNREAMWQETRLNLQTGAFGDPTNYETLLLFWEKMEMLHYPGAGETKAFIEERIQREQEAAQIQAMMEQAAAKAQAMPQEAPAGIPEAQDMTAEQPPII